MRIIRKLLLVVLVIFSSCTEKQVNEIEIPDVPVVKIISPANGDTLLDTCKIEVQATDDKGVVMVEIYINNQKDYDRTFYVEPYVYNWIVPSYHDSGKYSIYAKAYDGDDNVSSSEVIFINTKKFQVPTNPDIQSISSNSVRLKWSDNSLGEQGYIIEKRLSNGTYAGVDTLAADTETYLLENLGRLNIYTYRIAVWGLNGEMKYSSPISFKYSEEYELNREWRAGYEAGETAGGYTSLALNSSGELYFYSYEGTNSAHVNNFENTIHSSGYTFEEDELVSALAFDTKSNKFLIGFSTGTIYSWEYGVGSNRHMFTTNSDSVTGMWFHPKEDYFVSTHSSGRLILWDYDSRIPKWFINANYPGNSVVTITPDGKYAITGNEEGYLKFWGIDDSEVHRVSKAHSGKVTKLYADNTGNQIISTGEDGLIVFWDATALSAIKQFSFESTQIRGFGLSILQHYFFYLDNNNTITVYDYALNKQITNISLGPSEGIAKMEVTKNGEYIIASLDRKITIWKYAPAWRIIH